MTNHSDAYGLCVGGNGKLMKSLPLLLADQNQKAGQDVLPIKTLSITGSAEAKAFAAKLAEGHGYPVKIQGYKDGKAIDETVNVDIVKGSFSIDPKADILQQLAPVLEDIREGKVQYITSNTYKGFDNEYPPILVELLKAGFDAGLEKPIPVFPMELTANNGDLLKQRVLDIIDSDPQYRDHKDPAHPERTFVDWVKHTYFANTTVDRIVADDTHDPTMPLAEAFAYIAIEKPKQGVSTAVTHPFGTCAEIEWVDDIETAQTRKLGILNAMHTAMTQQWILEGRQPPDMTVRQFMDTHPEWMEAVRHELVSVVDKWLPQAHVDDYSLAIKERFMNPFNNHRLNEIATNHSIKLDQRINMVLDWKIAHPDQTAQCATPTLDRLMAHTVSARQLDAAKQQALGAHDVSGLADMLDEAMKINNPQPHKGEEVVTREMLTTKADLATALAGLESRLGSVLRSDTSGAKQGILEAYRTNAGISEGRSV